jgi:hypothetical protein
VSSFKLKDLKLQLATLRLADFTPPPRKVVLLPDTQFFVRSVAIAEGAQPGEVATQVELALEGLAPFALSQMAFAYYWTPGSQQALVYAAYRKRFTVEQTDDWQDAEAVLPAFAVLLNAQVQPFTTLILATETTITAINWGASGDVPTAVVSRPFPPEATDADRAIVREELLRNFDAGRAIDLPALPVLAAETDNGEYTFTSGPVSSTFTREQLDVLDVRDKDALVAIREARKRDVIMWRAFVGCALAVAACLAMEVGLVGLKFWDRSRAHKIERQAPAVELIRNGNTFATRIEELSTKRLRPFLMIQLAASKKTPSIVFKLAQTDDKDRDTLHIDASTTSLNDLDAFRAALSDISTPIVEPGRTEGDVTTFRVTVKFRPELLNPPAS